MNKKVIPGILFCAATAAAATALSGIKTGSFSLSVIGAPIFAILIGMLITLAFPGFAKTSKAKDGIKFTSKKILQTAVVILGFSLNIGVVAKTGLTSLPIIVSTIATSLIIAFLMKKALRMDANSACLIGVGSSICGGSAIAATATVIDADDNEIARAISVVFLFNVIAALVFPYMGHALGLGSEGFAIFAGTAVNDTSSVTATAATAENIYGIDGILAEAVTVKLTRTLAIIPITIAIALYRTSKAKKAGEAGTEVSIRKIFPWFVIWFLAASVVTSLIGLLPDSGFTAWYMASFVSAMKWLAKFFIAMAMSAVGLNTNIKELVKNGAKPITLGLCCWVGIMTVSLLMQLLTGTFYTEILH